MLYGRMTLKLMRNGRSKTLEGLLSFVFVSFDNHITAVHHVAIGIKIGAVVHVLLTRSRAGSDLRHISLEVCAALVLALF